VPRFTGLNILICTKGPARFSERVKESPGVPALPVGRMYLSILTYLMYLTYLMVYICDKYLRL